MNNPDKVNVDVNHKPTSIRIEDFVELDYQVGDDIPEHLHNDLPDAASISLWIASSLKHITTMTSANKPASLILNLPVELSVRIVSNYESQTLNQTYRGKNSPTNVLSFESDIPTYIPSNLVGDLVICAQVVFEEAQAQAKTLSHHWAHMCVHGCLHLLGFDHIDDQDAQLMESIEVEILHNLGIDDPYQISTI